MIKVIFWTIFGVLSFVPVFLVGLFIYRRIYQQWRVWQADQIKLEQAMHVRLELDNHALGGYVLNLRTGQFTDLDTGEQVSKQKVIAALTGASFGAPIAQQVVDDGAPVVELPSLVPVQQVERKENLDL